MDTTCNIELLSGRGEKEADGKDEAGCFTSKAELKSIFKGPPWKKPRDSSPAMTTNLRSKNPGTSQDSKMAEREPTVNVIGVEGGNVGIANTVGSLYGKLVNKQTNVHIKVEAATVPVEPLSPDLQRLKSETEDKYKQWTEGMVMTKATRTILNKISKGKTWVTVTGLPGEGKTTAGYLVLKHLHEKGSDVFDVKTPDDYFKVRGTKQSVIMLNDIFGSTRSCDEESMKKWQNVLSDVLALSEHKLKDEDQLLGVQNQKRHEHKLEDENQNQNKNRPGLTVILISRLNVLKEASEYMGKYKQLVVGKDNVVNLSEAVHDVSERMKIWKYHAEHYKVTIGDNTVREVCKLRRLSHGFSHCCRLFAQMYSKDRKLNMKHFFSKPLNFLNQSMESLMKDSVTRSLMREMIKNDGSFDFEDTEDEKRYEYLSQTESLQDTYLTLNGRTIEFHHPSIYDSAAFVICQKDPSFVISHCSLSFLNERVRVEGLQQENKVHTHLTSLVHKSFEKTLSQRFQKEFKDRNIEGALSHSSFHDENFVSGFMTNMFPSHKLLLNISDKYSNKSFVFLMAKSGSDKILRYIHRYVELTEEEQREALLGVCEHSSVSSLVFLLRKYKNINLEVTDDDDQTPLLISTQKRSPDVIRQLLLRNVNVNKPDKKGRTPLLNVCLNGVNGDGSIVKILLEKGADVTVTLGCQNGYVDVLLLLGPASDIKKSTNRGSTPLHLACQNGHVDVVSPLLEKEADINTTNSAGSTPLHLACENGHVDVVSLLLEKEADINTTESGGFTPLHLACLNGHVDVVSLLLEKEADISTITNRGSTPLCLACQNGHVDVVSLLLEKEADINTTNSAGVTPLHSACLNGHVDVVSLLLEKEADINTTESAGFTPLHLACLKGHVDVVSLLLGKGPDISTIINGGFTPLHLACQNGDVDVVSLLLEMGPDISTITNCGRTPIHIACQNGHVDVVSLLLEKEADINTTNSAGSTPLHLACENGHVDVVSLLLEKEADINTTNSQGDTPLRVACDKRPTDVVSLLLENGADINTANSHGNTPISKACARGHVDVVSLLLEKGVDINTTDSDGDTPLHDACYYGRVGVVSLLLDEGADISTINNDSDTPLHVACQNGQVEIVSLLLEKGADINMTNSDGDTPFRVAQISQHVDVMALFQ